MRPMRSLAVAACVALAPQLAAAQVTGSATSGATTANSFSSSTGGTASGGGSGSSDLSTSFGGSTSQLTRGASLGDTTGTGGVTVLSRSNAFARFSANPYYTGIPGTASNALPGGFGQALYGTNFLASTSTGGQSGINSGFTTGSSNNAFSGSSGGVFSSQSGFGGNSGQFGGTGSNQFGTQNRGGTQQQQLATAPNIVTQAPVRIAYTATLDFEAPKMTAPQMATDLRAVLDRSSMLTSARGIDLFTDGQVVIMRGTVATAREAKMAEGMVRLTPGVRGVKNELKIAGAPAPVPVPAP